MINDVVARELHVSRGWTREFVDKLAPYYLATLTHMSRGYVTPVFQVIDEVWHAHILCTRDYADFCARRFGRFIHHERTETANHGNGADDFFKGYGLSVAGLTSICAEHDLLSANRGQEYDEPLVTAQPKLQANKFQTGKSGQQSEVLRLAKSESEPGWLRGAICTSPDPAPAPAPFPPRFPSSAPRLMLANCSQPDQPNADPPAWAAPGGE